MDKIFSKTCILKFLMLLASTTAYQAQAQWKVGVEAGYDYNFYHIDTHYAYDFRYDGRSGFTVGVPVEYGILDWLAVRADLTYLQKGYKMHRGYNETFQNRSDQYLSLPMMARFSFGDDKLKGFLHVGGYVGYWLKSHLKGCEISNSFNTDEVLNEEEGKIFYPYDKEYSFNSQRDNRFDAGLVGGVGVCYRVLPQLEVEMEGRCYYGLTSTTKNYMEYSKQPRYNTTIVILAGIKYCF